MAKYPPAIWNKRVLNLGRDVALMYAYVLSCTHRGSEGLYRLPKAYIAADLDFTVDEVEKGLEALQGEGLIKYDDDAEVLLDPNALHFLPPMSEPQVKGAITKLREVPRDTATPRAPGLGRSSRCSQEGRSEVSR